MLIKNLLFGGQVPLDSDFPKRFIREMPENIGRNLAKIEPLRFLISGFLINAKVVHL